MTGGEQANIVLIHGSRCALGPTTSDRCSLHIGAGRIRRLIPEAQSVRTLSPHGDTIDLTGFLLLPGLVNAHDHLEFSLFPRLAAPPYANYIEWGEDIHARFAEQIALHRAVPKNLRALWGAIRNLLSGVTTVAHHNPLRPEMTAADFPVRVMHPYGWAHSVALGGDLHAARASTPAGAPFILHAGEGTDARARQELWDLDQRGLLDASAVLVHGLALDARATALLIERHSSLIVCPSSNRFLFDALPDLSLLSSIPNLTLGNDSPLTAEGDLLDELRFALRFSGVLPQQAWSMVTSGPAQILRLRRGEGTLQPGGVADLIAVRDTGGDPADALARLIPQDVELVMIGGRVQLASETMLPRIPPAMRRGLECLRVDDEMRWVRAPVAQLVEQTEQVLGRGQVRLGTRPVTVDAKARCSHAG
ncbi:MAG TPA: amidohydrolase family protein [Acidobacteriaceae bacterium]|jgi:cytosine/adenosine deaminase-related metal-dependent hydrolase|nr:amidohydrolase family protein [Acidobacteriaceae bacterium]